MVQTKYNYFGLFLLLVCEHLSLLNEIDKDLLWTYFLSERAASSKTASAHDSTANTLICFPTSSSLCFKLLWCIPGIFKAARKPFTDVSPSPQFSIPEIFIFNIIISIKAQECIQPLPRSPSITITIINRLKALNFISNILVSPFLFEHVIKIKLIKGTDSYRV